MTPRLPRTTSFRRACVRCLAALCLAALLAPLVALAGLPATRTQVLLRAPATRERVRARLRAYADSAAAGDAYGAGEAWSALGGAYRRAGFVDSAIVAWRRAVELRGAREDQLALIEALLARRGPGDVAGAADRAAQLAEQARGDAPEAYAPVVGLQAWAEVLAGQPDSAAARFATVRRVLVRQREWRYRMARAASARRQNREVIELLLGDAVLARGADEDVMHMLDQAASAGGLGARAKDEVVRRVSTRDRAEAESLAAIGGRRVSFDASDQLPLAGALFEAPGARRPGAVLLVAPGDTLMAWDSLAVALHRHGVTTLVLELRGVGASVSRAVPAPEAWVGREDAMVTRSARDVVDAVRALARESGVDSTRILVGAAGPGATIAAEAAERFRGIRALLLASPAPAPSDRGITALRLQRAQLPAFFQIAPEDYATTLEITEALYQAGNRAASREVEATVPGHGAEVFRADPALATRFLGWLDGAWNARGAARATTARRR